MRKIVSFLPILYIYVAKLYKTFIQAIKLQVFFIKKLLFAFILNFPLLSQTQQLLHDTENFYQHMLELHWQHLLHEFV